MGAQPSQKKILLVDDSATILMLEKMILARSYRLVEAHNGADAIDVARREKPDLILMDIVMPRMDGLSACRRLRELPETADTPIVLVTTKGESEAVENGYLSGCNDYVTKPIDALELTTKIRNLVGP